MLSTQKAHLQPFSPKKEALEIAVQVQRKGSLLSLAYRCLGNIECLSLPKPADPARRLQGLWEETCFEAFISREHTTDYWELNAAPSGHWNVYYFNGYRAGGREEKRIQDLSLKFSNPSPQELKAEIELDLRLLWGDEENPQKICLNLSAVLKNTEGIREYYALLHPKQKPDFHLRSLFCLKT